MIRSRLLQHKCLIALALVALTAFGAGVPQAAMAGQTQPASMMRGLKQLNDGDYRSALGSFQEAVKVAPRDVQVRYCLAVAYHYLGFLQEAESEYTWVTKAATDPNLQRRAKKGIASCRDVEMPMGLGLGRGALSRAQALEQFGRAAAAKPPLFTQGMPSVVNFWVGWCGWSQRFKEMLVAANKKYGSKVKFVLVDADAKTELRDQWGVSSYPTTFLFDGNGNMLTVFDGCPKTFDSFEELLKVAYPEIDPNYVPPRMVPVSPGTVTSMKQEPEGSQHAELVARR